MTPIEKDTLQTLEKLFKNYRIALRDAADTIRTENISNYPIFIAAQQDIEIGIPLLKRGEMPDDWYINASTLEEFHAKQIIAVDKVDDFIVLYRKHIHALCIAAFTEGGAKFIFLP